MSIENNYTYHPPKPGQQELYTKVRAKTKELAELIESLGSCREFSVAQTNLETVCFWVNAGIARNGIVEKEDAGGGS